MSDEFFGEAVAAMRFEHKYVSEIRKCSAIGNYARKANLISSITINTKTQRIFYGLFNNRPRHAVTPIGVGNKIMDERDIQFVMRGGNSVGGQVDRPSVPVPGMGLETPEILAGQAVAPNTTLKGESRISRLTGVCYRIPD